MFIVLFCDEALTPFKIVKKNYSGSSTSAINIPSIHLVAFDCHPTHAFGFRYKGFSVRMWRNELKNIRFARVFAGLSPEGNHKPLEIVLRYYVLHIICVTHNRDVYQGKFFGFCLQPIDAIPKTLCIKL